MDTLFMRALGRQEIDSHACGRRTLVEMIYSEITLKMHK